MDDIELRHEVVGSDEPGATVRDDELLQAGFDAAPHQGMALEHPHGFFDERDDFGREIGIGARVERRPPLRAVR
jgi:hypothetical protein